MTCVKISIIWGITFTIVDIVILFGTRFKCGVSSLSVTAKFTVLETLKRFFNYDCELFFIVNFIILMRKYYIYIYKKDAKLANLLSLYSFKRLIKEKSSILNHIYMNQNKRDLYKERFGKLHGWLQR